MRGIDYPQQRPAHAELDLIAVVKIRRISYSLMVEERAVEAFQIDDDKMITAFVNLSMFSRYDRRGGVDYNFAFRIATKVNHLFV